MIAFRIFQCSLAAALATLHTVGAAALAADSFPPPGLYRIDFDGAASYRDGATVQQKYSSGAGGTTRMQAPGQPVVTLANPGTPGQICIGPRTAAGSLPMPPMVASQHCKGSAPVSGPNGTSASTRCDSADITVVSRKLDAKTWEITSTISEHLGDKGALDFDRQRKMFEITAKNGATADDRAAARDMLDHWEDYKKEARADAAAASGEQRAANAPGAVTRTSTIVGRYTRLGDSCKVAAAGSAAAANNKTP